MLLARPRAIGAAGPPAVPAFAPGDYGTGSGRSVLCCLAWSRSAKRSSRASRACTCCSVPFVAAIRRRTLCSFCACGAKEGICDEPRNVCSSAATCEGSGEGGEATAMAVDDDSMWGAAAVAGGKVRSYVQRARGKGSSSPDQSAARALPDCPGPPAPLRRTCVRAGSAVPSDPLKTHRLPHPRWPVRR